MSIVQQKQWHIVDDTICTTLPQLVEVLLCKRDASIASPPPIADPSIFTNMQPAVERIWQAVTNKETVYIFGDYDCDGVTGTAQLVRYFLRKGISPIVKLPHRVKDGYGVQMHNVQAIIDSGATLLITVDTGITATAEVATLHAAGIDTIITDHHQPPEVLPEALAIIHPLQSTVADTFYPAGAGVVHFLVRALEQDASWEGRLYDEVLMMIGTVGDLVPLTGMNRSLVHLGLQAFKRLPDSPVHQLLTLKGKEPTIVTSELIAYTVVPPLNAAGRLADPTIALKALLGDAQQLELLVRLNDHRKEQTKALSATVLSDCTSVQNMNSPLIAQKDAAYHHGIIGLIAGQATEATGKPSLIAVCHDGICTASLRSTPLYNIMGGLDACSHLLLRYGGHHQAAGCSFNSTNWDEVINTLTNHILSTITLGQLQPVVQIHACIEPSLLTLQTYEQLQTLQPFGTANVEPYFLLKNVQLADVRAVGAEKTHLQCSIHGVQAIGFSLASRSPELAEPVDVICMLQTNTWQGTTKAQVQIIDFKVAAD